jgi:ATP-binding cassette subfamily B protein
MKKTVSTTRHTLRVYWQHTRKYKRQLWVIYPTMVVAQIAEDFIQPLLVSGLLNKIATGQAGSLSDQYLLKIFVAITLLEAGAHLLWNRIIVPVFWRTQDAIMRDLNITIFNHLSKMSYRFFSDRFGGSIVSQTNKFVGSFERLSDPLTWNIFKLVVSLIVTTAIVAPRAPGIMVALWLVIIIYIPVIWYYRKKQVPYNTRWAKAETKRTGQVADAITNIQAVKAFATESSESQRMQVRADEVFKLSMNTMKVTMRQELVSGGIQRSISIIALVAAIFLAVRGRIEIGMVYLISSYVMTIMARLWDLNNSFRQFTRVFGDEHDMAEILQIEPEVSEPKNPIPFEASAGLVEFKDVDFWYPDHTINEALFRNFNLKINPGEKIGLVGPSGGGKTSITKLILRFMDIQGGKIEIDSCDIASITQANLRRAITYVPQEPLLFHRSIRENIAYGQPYATEKQILEASKKAHAHEFVSKLRDGYDTLVGERGVKLSGGQKQRIAIARAMLKDAPIVILDEATSALDSESEALIQAALKDLLIGKTAIVIAHRLSTIASLDRIVVLEDGKIVEEGNHETLKKKKNGLYARLWSHQSGGFIQE